MKGTLVLLFIFLLPIVQGVCQDTISKHFLKKENYEWQLEKLKDEFGKNKTIPKDYELEILTALSFYPEFANTKIDFRLKKFRRFATMTAQPEPFFLFKNKAKRRYIISMNNNQGRKKGTDINSLGFNALVGIIAHELGHLADYAASGNMKIVWLGFTYSVSKKSYIKTEIFADQAAVKRGLGYAVYELRDIAWNNKTLPPRYKKKLLTLYQPKEKILEYILNHEKGLNP